MKTEKVRQSNFELLRIICMVMIVFLHYMGRGGGLEHTKPWETNFFVSHFIEAFSIVAVNCYIFISGYFLILSDFKIKKLITLWLQVLFYSIGIYFVCVVIGVENVSAKTLFRVAFPILLKQYWFVSGYIALLLLSPFLNISIKLFGKNELEKLIAVLIFLQIIWGNSVPQGFLFVNNGYSLSHFIFLYILAAYIRLYWNFKVSKYIYIFGYLICSIIIGFVSIPLYMIDKIQWWNSYILDYSFIFVFLSSFCLFMFMRDISITSAFINRIAPFTLGVYLIHEHFSIRKVLYTNILKTNTFIYSDWFIVHALVSVIAIFIISICIDAGRKFIFDKISSWVENKYTNKSVYK